MGWQFGWLQTLEIYLRYPVGSKVLRKCWSKQHREVSSHAWTWIRLSSWFSCLANSRDTDVQALLRRVVVLDYPRILTRLRSRHAKSFKNIANKPPRIIQLRAAVYDESVGPEGSVSQENLEEIRSRATDLENLFLRFESVANYPQGLSAAESILRDILKQAHELTSQTDLGAALRTSSKLEASLKQALPEAIGKLGRYYSASHDLVRTASSSRYRLFRRISIETTHVPEPIPIKKAHQKSTLDKILEHLFPSGNRDGQNGPSMLIESYLVKPFPVVQEEFRTRLSEHNKHAKVHAEIQILFFYEFNAKLPRPRVICSSKDACYLCDLFVKLHGKFCMPRTHGRLYGLWTLPDVPWEIPKQCQRDLNLLTKRFNTELEKSIKVIASNARMPFSHPNESVLVPAASWSSSTLSKAPAPLDLLPTLRPEQIKEGQHPGPGPVALLASIPISRSGSIASSSRTIRDSCQTFRQDKAFTATTTPTSANHSLLQLSTQEKDTRIKNLEPVSSLPLAAPLTESIVIPKPAASQSSSIVPLASNTRLERGQSNCLELSDPNYPLRVETDNLHLILSRDDTIDHTNHNLAQPHKYWVKVRWINPSEHMKITNSSSEIVNVGELGKVKELTLERGGHQTSTEIYLRYGGMMVGIKYASTIPPELEPEPEWRIDLKNTSLHSQRIG